MGFEDAGDLGRIRGSAEAECCSKQPPYEQHSDTCHLADEVSIFLKKFHCASVTAGISLQSAAFNDGHFSIQLLLNRGFENTRVMRAIQLYGTCRW